MILVLALNILLVAQVGPGASSDLDKKLSVPTIFKANGTPVASVSGVSQEPKFIIDTLTFSGGSAKLRLNTDLNGGKHRTMPTANERLWILSVHPAHLVKIDSSKLDMDKKWITFWRNGSDTLTVTIQLLIQ